MFSNRIYFFWLQSFPTDEVIIFGMTSFPIKFAVAVRQCRIIGREGVHEIGGEVNIQKDPLLVEGAVVASTGLDQHTLCWEQQEEEEGEQERT